MLRKKKKEYYFKKLLPEILQSTLFLGTNAFCFIGAFCLWRLGFLPFSSTVLLCFKITKGGLNLFCLYLRYPFWYKYEVAYHRKLPLKWSVLVCFCFKYLCANMLVMLKILKFFVLINKSGYHRIHSYSLKKKTHERHILTCLIHLICNVM